MHTIYNISMPPRRASDSKRPSEQRLLSRHDLEAPVDRVPVVDAERDDGHKQSKRERLARDLFHGREQFAQGRERHGQDRKPGGVRRERPAQRGTKRVGDVRRAAAWCGRRRVSTAV